MQYFILLLLRYFVMCFMLRTNNWFKQKVSQPTVLSTVRLLVCSVVCLSFVMYVLWLNGTS